MSFAALMAKPEASSSTRPASSGLRVGGSHDSFESEADRVADTVSGGGRIAGLSLSRMSIGQVQRQLMPSPSAEQANRRHSGLSMEEAFLQTDLGVRVSRSLSGGPHSEAAAEHAALLRTDIVAGPAAKAVVAGLAAARGPLPARVPAIALEKVYPGLKVHVTHAGPADKPVHASVSFSISPTGHAGAGEHAHARHEPHAPAGKGHRAHAASHHEHAAPHHGAEARHEDVPIQRKADRSAPFVADRSAVDGVLSSPGRPLDPGTLRYMESRIGYDFGRVRVHTDSRATDSARALGAQAYTSGNHVVFGQGRFSPESTAGRRLIAHELTHVVQQDSSPGRAHPVIRRAPVQIQRSPEEDGAADTGSGSWFTNPIDKLKAIVRKIPGFKLFTVVLGSDPVSGAKVERNATNVTHGVLELVPGGEEAFEHVKESGSLEKAFKWLGDQLNELGFTLGYFKGLVDQALGSVKWGDITDPAGALARVAGFFKPPLEKLKKFALAALDKMLELVVEGVLSALGGLGVLEVLKKAGAAFNQIVKDPVGFLKNLLKSLSMGFNQFKDRIVEHLKNGLVQWLFGQIAATGITLPKHFDLSGIVNLVLQVLGLTYARIRKRLADVIGDGAVTFLENTFDFLMAMKKEGPGAAWKMILEKASGLIDSVMASIRGWVVTKIVTTAVVKLATMFNPVGAIIQAIQVIYKTVTFFIEKTKQIVALANAVLDSVTEIAAGNLARAANFVEQSMAKTIPLMLGFLADLIGLGGIGEQIRKIIEGIQAKVDGAIKKILEMLGKKAMEIYGNGKEVLANAIQWWKKRSPMKVGGEDHELFLDGDEEHPAVMVASSAPTTLEIFLENMAPGADRKRLLAMARAIKFRKKVLTVADAKGNNDGEAKFQALLAEMKQLKVLGKDLQLPKSESEPPGALDAAGGGTSAVAYLSLNHPVGSAPNRTAEPACWGDLGPALRKRKSYVRGHLLSQRLGGKGEWFNMMPITNAVNQRMLSDFERPIINQVATGKTLIYYRIDAKYKQVTKADAKIPARAEQRMVRLSLEYGNAVLENNALVKVRPKKIIDHKSYDPKET